MGLGFRIGGFPSGAGLIAAVDDSLARGAERWAFAQRQRLFEAFMRGGHGSRGGRQWQPRSRDYAERLAREGRSPLTLVVTGTLRNSLFQNVSRSPFAYVVSLGSARGPSSPYAAVMQYGSVAKRIPARAFVVITSRDREKLKTELRGSLREVLRRMA